MSRMSGIVLNMALVGLLVLVAMACVGEGLPMAIRIEDDPELTAGYIEGDMLFGVGARNGLRNESLRWPNRTVYYKFFDNTFDEEHRNHIFRGMKAIEEVSCIRFLEADEAQTYYVNITGFSDGCYSLVGFWDRPQTYNLAVNQLDKGCFRIGTIIHEFLHTLGFYHQQSASTRDEYVRIAEENILEGTIHNFNKYEDDVVTEYGEEYDYRSILHYSAYAFSANGEMTIIPLKDEEAAKSMGQRLHLTQSDINKLNIMYKCPHPL